MVESKNQRILIRFVSYFILTIAALMCVIPFLIVISASLSSEGLIAKAGYSIFPRGFTTSAYEMIFQNPGQLLKSYYVTIFVTVVGSILSVLLTSLTAYPLSRADYKWKRGLSFYFYFTMLFSGGAIPTYILISQYLNMRNNIWVLIIPLMLNVWNVFLLRTYFSNIHISIIEAAKIDGASELRTFFVIVLPLSITGIATILLLVSLFYWNEWYMCLMYMTDEKIISLQYFLQRIMSNIDAIMNSKISPMALNIDVSNMPSETARMAMCVLAAGPMIFVFMAFQKYFIKGISVGSVKG